ncbi:MAG: OmpA family protein, partial [Bacteroidota bacterium]
AVNLGPPINTNANEGAQCISPDGQYIFYTACNRNGGYGSCDLYYTRKQGGRWESPVNMGPIVNSKLWDTQPSISSDGKTLYFISTREGGLGNSDVWKTTLDVNGEWTKPVNLGAPVNTIGKELSAFIHPDNQTMYFASDGHIGMGGLDMYYTRIDSAGKYTAPVNLGYPINTVADESSMIVSASGMMAYFASNSFTGNGRYDLYGFELYEKARPRVVTYLKGIVFDKTSLKRLGARFQLIDLKTKEIVVESESDPVDGTFLVCIPTNKEYALHVTKGNDYIFYSDNFYVKGNFESSKPFLKDIPLEPVTDGSKFVLRNIFFDFDQSTLRPESYIELEKLQKFLKDNPKIKVEIGGHTDSNGDDAYNMKLSAARAKTVVDYLIANGITKDRMTFKGYGETMPIIKDAKTDEEHQMNRRTEIKIISH